MYSMSIIINLCTYQRMVGRGGRRERRKEREEREGERAS